MATLSLFPRVNNWLKLRSGCPLLQTLPLQAAQLLHCPSLYYLPDLAGICLATSSVLCRNSHPSYDILSGVILHGEGPPCSLEDV